MCVTFCRSRIGSLFVGVVRHQLSSKPVALRVCLCVCVCAARMIFSVADYLLLSEKKLHVLSAPHAADDGAVCYLTMEEISALTHVAHASDGRTYEAFALRTWLLEQQACTYNKGVFHVIPACPITHVSLYPHDWILSCVASTRRCVTKVAYERLLQPFHRKIRALQRRPCPKPAERRRPQQQMLLRVISACREQPYARFKRSRRLIPSDTSAFSVVIPKERR